MDIGVILTVFAIIFVAELPDKTMIATLIMGSRYRPVLVWAGASAAFLVHVVVAVAIGRLLQLLPHDWIEGVTAALFGAGALYLLLVPEKEEEQKADDETGDGTGDGTGRATGGGGAPIEPVPAATGFRVVGSAFGIILVGELGDLTQILTANLAAKYRLPFSVGIGAFAALTSVAAVGAFGGRMLLRVLPLAVIRKAGGVLLAGFAIYTVVNLVR